MPFEPEDHTARAQDRMDAEYYQRDSQADGTRGYEPFNESFPGQHTNKRRQGGASLRQGDTPNDPPVIQWDGGRRAPCTEAETSGEFGQAKYASIQAEKQLGCGEPNAFVNSDPTTAVEDSSPPSHPRRLHCDPPRPMQEMPGRRPRARRPRNCSTQSGVGQGADDGNRNAKSRHRRRHSPDEKQDLQIQRGITPENQQQQQQLVRHTDEGHNGMKLRLDLNLEVEVTLKASIHGDLTLALLYVGSCDPTALIPVPAFCPRPSSMVRGFPFQAVKTPNGRTNKNRWGGTLLTTSQ